MRKLVQTIYHIFNNALYSIIKFSWRHSKITLTLFTLVTLFFLANVNKMKIVFTAEDLAGQGFSSADELKHIKARYQDGVPSLFIIEPPVGKFSFNLQELCIIRRWYSQKRNTTPELLLSQSTFDFKLIKREKISEELTKVRVRNLLDLNCRDEVLNGDIQTIQKTLNETPFALAQEKKQQLSLLFQFVFQDSSTSKFGVFDPIHFQLLRESVHKELLPKLPGAKVHWIGSGDYQWYILEGFKFSKWINLGMIIFMLVGLRLFFGTWKSGFIYISTLFISAIWVFGAKGAVGSTFDVLSTGLLLLLAISSLEDFTFTCYDQNRSGDWRKSILKIAVPSFYTSLTTILGFWALRTSEVDAISKMGTWAAWGSLVQWILLFIFIPSFLQQFPNLRRWGNPNKALKLTFFENKVFSSLPMRISAMALIIYPLAILFYSRLDFNESPMNVFPKKQEYAQSIDYLKDSKGWVSNASLLFEPNLPEQEQKDIVRKILDTNESQELVTQTETTWDIKTWLKEKGNLDQLESESYFNISKVEEQFVDESLQVRALLYLKETTVESVTRLKNKVNEICGNRCHLGGEVVAYSDFASLVPRSLIDSLYSSLLQVSLVIIFIAFAQNKERYIPSLLMAAYWGPFFVIMVLGMMGMKLDFWKSIFSSILIGLAGDNAIHFLFGSENKNIEAGIEDRGTASIITALLMAFGALIYLGSYFNSPREFGVILSVGLLASLFGELWLFQGLMDIDFVAWFKKKKNVILKK